MKAFWTRLGLTTCLCALGALGCGPATEEDESLGTLGAELNPGSNAQFISSNIPTTMFPGERLNVQVTMRNTGTQNDGSNTWGAGYSFARTNTAFGWTAVTPPSTPINTNRTFALVITAPGGNGTFSFGGRMKQDLFFGQEALVSNINVNTANTPRWRCTYVPGSSTVPTMMSPGENRFVNVTVQNTGSATWGNSGFLLRSVDTPVGFWNQTNANLTATIAPNATHTFGFSIKAPTTPGTYTFQRQMQDTAATGVGIFNNTPCVDLSITVAGTAALNSSLVSNTLPTTMAPGETRATTITLKNTGTQTWAADGNYVLYTENTPASLWGVTSAPVSASTATNVDRVFSLIITAPSTPGNYNHRWRMRKFAGTDAGSFGVTVDVPVVVDPNATPDVGATVVDQAVPLLVTAGEAATFTIRMQNTGSSAWTGSNFALYTRNTPSNLWNLTSSALGAAETVAAGAQHDFVLNVTAPATVGTYTSDWQMRQLSGIGFFGEHAVTTGVQVTLCGNNVIDAGEVCDDDNLTNGDGCSDQCQTETTEYVDLAVDAADRTIFGTQDNKQMANVAVGDITDTSALDVAVGQNINVVPGNEAFRNQAGRVSVFSGANVFSGGAAATQVLGAEANDSLGAHNGGAVVIGEVTGDARADLIVSAAGADGVMNARSGCGEVYVLAGGSLTATMDLKYVTPTAHIVGAAANHALMVLATGDVTGDGVGDLLLGATGAQRLYVLAGPLSGEIDLATAPSFVISGPGIGATATIGNLGSTATADILIGSPANNTNAGSAWAVFGPVTGNKNLALAAGAAGGPNAVFNGAGANDRLGASLAIADVAGSASNDVIIGALQQRKAGAQVGAANIWTGPITNGTTRNLSSLAANVTIQGREFGDGFSSGLAAGDWNGDGIADLFLGAYSADGPSNGRDGCGEMVIVPGSRNMAATLDLSVYVVPFEVAGGGARDLMLSRPNNLAIGDFDGNGRQDFCVGSPKGGTNATLTAPGRVDCFQ